MNAVRSGSARDVRAIVDQQSSGAAARNLGCLSHQLKEHTRRKILFAKLYQTNASVNRRGDKFADAREVFT